MNKTAIKNFAIWARNKLIADITYKAGLLGITEKEIKSPLPQSTKDVQFFDIGTKEPYSIIDVEIGQRRKLVEAIQKKERQSDYKTAYKGVIEEVAYTWFNRLIAVRFMEVNDYIPSRIRVLSSESSTKIEPDLVTSPFDAGLEYTPYEKDRIMQLKDNNQLNELFRMLFIKQCNALNTILPELFEKTNDYTELLMNVSFTDKDGIVYHLVHDISENDFNVEKEGQVEIIGWLYQYYNTDVFNQIYNGDMSKRRVSSELLPAATQLFTPDWAVKYMVENSLGKLWTDHNCDENLINNWKYFVHKSDMSCADGICSNNGDSRLDLTKIKVIDPCMGSGHILVYAFDVLIQLYLSSGFTVRDAAISILKYNIYGIDIDKRAYQLAYFSVMMKARSYNRHIFYEQIEPNLCYILNSKSWTNFRSQDVNNDLDNSYFETANYLIDLFKYSDELGSILKVERRDFQGLKEYIDILINRGTKDLFELRWLDKVKSEFTHYIKQAMILSTKYDVIITNPPYLGGGRMSPVLENYIENNYKDAKADFSMVMYQAVASNLLKKNGYISFITTVSWMFLKSFEPIRRWILAQQEIVSLVDFGTELFEGKVGHLPIVSWVCKNTKSKKPFVSIRLVDFCYGRRDEKQKEFYNVENWHIAHQKEFDDIPGSPVAYWVSHAFINNYKRANLLGDIAKPRQGMATCDNNRFLRNWFEVCFNNVCFTCSSVENSATRKEKWFPYNKGGNFRKWYGNNDFVINWEHNGAEVRQYATQLYKTETRTIKNIPFFFNEGITYTFIGFTNLGVRYSPMGFIFDVAGSTVFVDNKLLKYILGFMLSRVANSYLKILNPTVNFQVGDIKNIPLIVDESSIDEIDIIVQKNIEIAKNDWDSFETSWDFDKHTLISHKTSGSIAGAFENWELFAHKEFLLLKSNEEELNRIFIEIYGLKDELTPEIEDKNITIRRADLGRDVRSFISYAVGCIFGRYSLDVDELAYAGGEWDDGIYKTFIPDKDNILPITDEEYFEDDVVGLFCAFLRKTFGSETLEENLDFIAKALGNKGNSSREMIRNYFLKDFFKDHCKIYQKRPIYWLFDSGKADGFKALIYMHRYDENTIGNMRIDYLHRMQRIYENEIVRMQETIENSTNAREVTAAEKRKEKLTKQLKETKDYDEKIAHLALARIAIDLDDGVKVNYEKVQTGTDGKKLDVLAKI